MLYISILLLLNSWINVQMLHEMEHLLADK